MALTAGSTLERQHARAHVRNALAEVKLALAHAVRAGDAGLVTRLESVKGELEGTRHG